MGDTQKALFSYMLNKQAVTEKEPNSVINFQDYFDLLKATHTEKSKTGYVKVMDAVADSKETIIQPLHDLYAKFIKQYLVLEGDQKLYQVFQSLVTYWCFRS